MKLIFLVILSLFSGHLKADTSAFDVAKRFSETNEDHDRTKFADLDPDCLFLILDYLPLGDLLRLAHIDDKLSMVAKDIFHYKYSQRSFIVDTYNGISDSEVQLLNGAKIDADTIEQLNRYHSHLMNETHREIQEFGKDVPLCNFFDIFGTFKHFGHLIKNFDIINHEIESKSTEKSAVIGYLISEYSSEALVDITFKNDPDQVLKYITKPLTKVENVKLQYGYDSKLETSLTRFSELFPAVRRLYLSDRIGDDPTFTDCHMPHLEHVSIERFKPTASSFLNVISKNPQIRNIDLYRPERDFLQNVSILLRQLQTLKLDRFSLRSGSIRFENVTTFDIGRDLENSPANLHFPRLQTLHASELGGRFEQYVTFLNEHTHLNNLHLIFMQFQMGDLQFQRLTANLNDLVELTVDHYYPSDGIQRLSTKAIEEFLKSHEKMEQFNAIKFSLAWQSELQERLKHEWNMRCVDGGVSFERK